MELDILELHRRKVSPACRKRPAARRIARKHLIWSEGPDGIRWLAFAVGSKSSGTEWRYGRTVQHKLMMETRDVLRERLSHEDNAFE
jgi:hypothetical protein